MPTVGVRAAIAVGGLTSTGAAEPTVPRLNTQVLGFERERQSSTGPQSVGLSARCPPKLLVGVDIVDTTLVGMWLQSTTLAMLTALTLLPSCACLRPGPGPRRAPGITRRAAGCGLLAAALASSSQSSLAFDNGVPEMARFKNEKKSGVDIPLYTPNNKKPLGLQDNGMLATCNDDPNCFSTTGGSRNLLEVWSPKAGDAQPGDAMGELLAALKAYPPGQNGACLSPGGSSSCIDGGGFQIVSSTPSYLYVQFESLKYVPHARSRTVHVPPMCPWPHRLS